jgi:hypothetical protein
MGSGGAPALWPPGRASSPAAACPAGEAAGGRWQAGAWARPSGPLRMRLSLEGSRSVERLGPVSLHALPRFHTRPIDVVVYHGSDGETWF